MCDDTDSAWKNMCCYRNKLRVLRENNDKNNCIKSEVLLP